MRFSILIAHYNNYHYFTECYKSILNQTYQDFEIILVDDCSTDNSLEQITRLTEDDKRVKIYKNDENRGVGYTKRKCVELASGIICGFVDPDDALVENALKRCMAEYSNPKVVATHSQFQLCDSCLNPGNIFQNTRAVKDGNIKFFNMNLEVNHFFTFRKQSYDNTSGINASLTSAVDQDLYLKLYETGTFRYIPEPLYRYRLHDKGVSQQKSKKSQLNQNWHQVLKDTLKRRKLTKLYGRNAAEIDNLPEFIFEKQNGLLDRIIRKIR